MKTFREVTVLLFLALALVNVSAADDSKVPLLSRPVLGGLQTNVWMVSLSTLKKAPKWKIGEGEPPLSVGKAIELARNWIVSRQCNTNSWVQKVTIRPVDPERGEYQHVCYYNIVFGGVGVFGHYRRCIMLMDGTIVEPAWRGVAPKYPLDYSNYDE